MRRLKRTAVLLASGFLLFAPPGTLLFGAALLLTLFGRRRWLLVGALCAAAGVCAWLWGVRRRGRRKPETR